MISTAIFKPMTIAADVSADAATSYAAIAEKLVRITTEENDVEGERTKLRALPTSDVTSRTVDEMRRLTFRMLDLFQEELQVRIGELSTWFTEFGPVVNELIGRVKKSRTSAAADVLAKLIRIGFTENKAVLAVIPAHESVQAIDKRLERLANLHKALVNPHNQALGNFPPMVENSKRIEDLSGAIKKARELAGSPLQEAAFV